MYFNFSSCLLQYLLSNGSASLPGLGTFYIRESTKDFTLTENVLSPPTNKLVFEDNSHEDVGFVQYVASRLEFNIEEAKAFIADSVHKINADLERGKPVSISGLGKFKIDGVEKSFTPVSENFHPDFLYLPTLSLKPLTKGKQKKSVKKEPENTTNEKIGKVSAIDKDVVPVDPKKNSGLKDKMSIMEDHNSSNKSNTNSNSNTNANTNTNTNTYTNTNTDSYYYEDDKSFFQEIRGPLFWILLLGLAVFLISRFGCSKLKNSAVDAVTETTDKVGDIKDSVLESETSNKLLTPDGEEYTGKYSDVLTQNIIDEGCVIVVGSFKKSKNALRMRNRIIERGYQPFDEYHNGYNRVGIIFDCLDQDLVDFLQEIRRNIEPKSWYRIPGFDVAYE